MSKEGASQEASEYFTRPDIETTEEIAAGFQFQKAPPRDLLRGSNGKQQLVANPSSPGNQEAAQSLCTTASRDCNDQLQSLLSTDCEDEQREATNGIQFNTLTKSKGNSQHVSSNNAHDDQLPEAAASAHFPDEDSSTFPLPFPDDNGLPRSNRSRPTSSYSSLSKSQLPKSISDIRQKALVQMPTYHRQPKKNSPVSPQASPQPQPVKVSRIIVDEVSPENEIPPVLHEPSQNVNKPHKNSQATRGYPSKKHRHVERQKREGLLRPIDIKAPENQAFATTRPCSQASNVSKLRVPPRARHQRPSPTRKESMAHLSRFAESWNNNFVYNQKLLDRWEEKINIMKDHIATQDSHIEQYEREIESRDQNIENLSKEVEQLRSESQGAQNEVIVLRTKMKEKIESWRVRFNDAILEQQQLFTQTQKTHENVTAKLKAESQVRERSIEEAVKTLETTKAGIEREVAAVIKRANKQANESECSDDLVNIMILIKFLVNETIGALRIQLEEREANLKREQQHSKTLTEQLAEIHKLNEESLRSLTIQNGELVKKVEDERNQADFAKTCIQKQDEK